MLMIRPVTLFNKTFFFSLLQGPAVESYENNIENATLRAA